MQLISQNKMNFFALTRYTFFIALLNISFLVRSQTFEETQATGLPDLSLTKYVNADLDNDGFQDIIVSGTTDSLVTQVYFNNGDFTFITSGEKSFPPLYNSSNTVGDIDNDGFMDILFAGEGYDPIVELWRNNGDRTFTKLDIDLKNIAAAEGNSEIRDFNNDGLMDIMLAGTYKSPDNVYSNTIAIYENMGENTFTEVFTENGKYLSSYDFDKDGDLDFVGTPAGSVNLLINEGNWDFTFHSINTSISEGRAKWYDYDRNAIIDIIIAGRTFDGTENKMEILNNNDIHYSSGEDMFSPVSVDVFAKPARVQMEIGDLNLDGFSDLAVNGFDANQDAISEIYLNREATFSLLESGLPTLGSGSFHFLDLDNDGDLDVILSGQENPENGGGSTTKVYLNSLNSVATPSANTAPSTVSDIMVYAELENDTVRFSWNRASDEESNSISLTYDVVITNDNGELQTYSDLDLESGVRQANTTGNANNDTTHYFLIEDDGTFFIQIQTLDQNRLGSDLSEKQIFYTGFPQPPTQFSYSVVNGESQFSWIDNSSNEAAFRLEFYNENEEPGDLITVFGRNETMGVAELENGIYSFQLQATNPIGASAYAPLEDVAIGIPETPSNFTVEQQGGSSVSLSWDPVVNAKSYRISRAIGTSDEFEEIASVDRNSSSYTDDNAQIGLSAYSITAINENGESEFVSETIDLVLSSNSFDASFLFPNPAIDQLNTIYRVADFKIFNIAGSLILEGKITEGEIDVSGLKAGNYILELTNDKMTEKVKFIKQ